MTAIDPFATVTAPARLLILAPLCIGGLVVALGCGNSSLAPAYYGPGEQVVRGSNDVIRASAELPGSHGNPSRSVGLGVSIWPLKKDSHQTADAFTVTLRVTTPDGKPVALPAVNKVTALSDGIDDYHDEFFSSSTGVGASLMVTEEALYYLVEFWAPPLGNYYVYVTVEAPGMSPLELPRLIWISRHGYG